MKIDKFLCCENKNINNDIVRNLLKIARLYQESGEEVHAIVCLEEAFQNKDLVGCEFNTILYIV